MKKRWFAIVLLSFLTLSLTACGSSKSAPQTNVAAPVKAAAVQKGENMKALIVYFSWSGNTRAVAEEIQKQTGADLFETRLHLPERLEALSFLTHEDWNKAAKNYRTPELSEETISAFLDELCAGQFVYTWESERGIYDSAVQGHLFCALSDGTTVELRLIEGGYVGYQELGWYFVKMPGDVFDAVLAACQ